MVCDEGRIEWVGSAGLAPGADDELEVDGFLMPGAADRHVHIGLADPGAVLLGGVTAVRDLAWPPDVIFPLADASDRAVASISRRPPSIAFRAWPPPV